MYIKVPPSLIYVLSSNEDILKIFEIPLSEENVGVLNVTDKYSPPTSPNARIKFLLSVKSISPVTNGLKILSKRFNSIR